MISLEEGIGQRLAALDASTSFYARHLTTRQEVAIRADVAVNTLSTIKLAIMIQAYRDADAGLLDLDERHTLTLEDMRRGSGLLQTFAPGLQPTYRDLVTQMIITSDNTATDVMIARLGAERVNQMLADFGYTVTRLHSTIGNLFRRLWEKSDPAHAGLSHAEVFARGFPIDADAATRTYDFVGDPAEWLGRTTARETCRLLEQLVEGKLASHTAGEEMQSILQQQFYSSRMPARIGQRVAIGHKTGDWPPVAGHDVGILYSSSGPIVLAMYVSANRGPFSDVEATHASVAEAVLDAWE